MNDAPNNRHGAIRAALIDYVAARRSRRRIAWAAGLVAIGALAGAGVSAGAFAATESWSGGGGVVIEHPVRQLTPALTDPIVAPEGIEPGAPVITMVGEPTSVTITAATKIPLTNRPESATHLRVIVTCLTAGTITWGSDEGGNNPTSSCTVGDPGTVSATAWMDLPLDETVDTLFITPLDEATASVTLQYVNHVPTMFGVNERGETYGVMTTGGIRPDLMAVEITGPDGAPLRGYVRTIELDGAGPGQMPPSTPADALEQSGDQPTGWDIPVYESDGTTRLGWFHIGA